MRIRNYVMVGADLPPLGLIGLKIGELISEFTLKACLISADDLLVAIIFARVLPKFKVK